MPNWQLPGGVFSYQDKTPIQAISMIVDAVGAVILSDPFENVLNIAPRYKAMPWNWADATTDSQLHESQMLSE